MRGHWRFSPTRSNVLPYRPAPTGFSPRIVPCTCFVGLISHWLVQHDKCSSRQTVISRLICYFERIIEASGYWLVFLATHAGAKLHVVRFISNGARLGCNGAIHADKHTGVLVVFYNTESGRFRKERWKKGSDQKCNSNYKG